MAVWVEEDPTPLVPVRVGRSDSIGSSRGDAGGNRYYLGLGLDVQHEEILITARQRVSRSGGQLELCPSWGDRTIGTDVAMSMAQRAGAQITEVDSSHVLMISHPDIVAGVVRTAYEVVS